MRRLYLAIVAVCSWCAVASAQPLPHTVRVLLRRNVAVSLRSAFGNARTQQPDIQRIIIHDTALAEALSLPEYLRVSSLKPFLPQHSVVFEDIREHLNPELFVKSLSARAQSEDQRLLASSEDKLSRWFEIEYDANIAPDAAARICKKSPAIEAAEAIYPAVPLFKPNDSLIDQQYALPMMNAFEAWDVVRSDSTMLLADVDVGVQLDHPDLASAIWYNSGEIGTDATGHPKQSNGIDDDSDGFVDDWRGWDFAGSNNKFGDNNPSTAQPHGTHTTGILAATADNHIGIAGVAFGSKVIAVKTSSDQDETIYYGYQGIVYAADHNAKAINCSWGEPQHSQSGQDVIDYAYAKGCVVTVSSGDNSAFEEFYPASFEHAFSVGEVDENKQPTDSYQNKNVAVTAPGARIISTVPTSTYDRLSGTSMSAPEAAGAIALVYKSAASGPLHAIYPNITNRQAMEQVRATTSPISNDLNPGFNGSGIVDLYQAVTNTTAHSLRLESYSAVSSNGSTVIRPGDRVTIALRFKNYLAPLAHANARMELLDAGGKPFDSFDSVIRTSTRSLDLGAFATLEESSDPTTFTLDVAPSAFTPAVAYVRLWISDSSVGYVRDYDYVKLTIGPSYVTLDTNNVAISIFNDGAIGHEDPLVEGLGDGIVWLKPSTNVPPGNRDCLFLGGLMCATDSDHISQGFGTAFLGSTWLPLIPATLQWKPGLMDAHVAFSDSSYDRDVRVGLDVDLHSYEFTDPSAANAAILDYTFRAVDTLHTFSAGLYMDWDIGEYGFNNYANFDLTDSTFYIHRVDSLYPVVAMKIVSPIASGAEINYYAINNSFNNGGVQTNDDFTPREKWTVLNTDRPIAGVGDVALSFGERNINVRTAAAKITYAIGFGADLPSAKNAAFAAAARFAQRGGVSIEHSTPDLQLWPDPTQGLLYISIGATDKPIEVSIVDLLGRVLQTAHVVSGEPLDISSLPARAYLIEVNSANDRAARWIVKQ